MSLKFIDCNCSFGITRKAMPFMLKDKEEIKKELQKLNVVKAIVSHSSQKEFDLIYGNERVVSEVRNDDFFLPTMYLIPLETEEYKTIDEIDKFIDENSIKTITLSPSVHNFSPSVWNMREIYDYISQKKLPVLMSKNDYPFDLMYSILSEFKNLNVIYTDLGYTSDRSVMNLLKIFDNLHIETSSYGTLDGIEFITEKYGAERLVFGSGMPYFSAGASVSRILFANISDENKERIAYKNILRLTGEEC